MIGWIVAAVLPLIILLLGCLAFRWLLRNDPFWAISEDLDERRRRSGC